MHKQTVTLIPHFWTPACNLKNAGRNGIGWVPERAVVECIVRFRSHGTELGWDVGRGDSFDL